jgi:hypothetical protein
MRDELFNELVKSIKFCEANSRLPARPGSRIPMSQRFVRSTACRRRSSRRFWGSACGRCRIGSKAGVTLKVRLEFCFGSQLGTLARCLTR